MGLIVCTSEGTLGEDNYEYRGNGWLSNMYNQDNGMQNIYLPMPASACTNEEDYNRIVGDINRRLSAIKNSWPAVLDPDQLYARSCAMAEEINAIISESFEYSSRKFCLVKEVVNPDPTFYEYQYKVLYADGPTSHEDCGFATLHIIKPYVPIVSEYIITDAEVWDMYLTVYAGPGYNRVQQTTILGATPVFDNEQDALDYLSSDQPIVDPSDDPSIIGPHSPNTPIQPSVKWEEVAHTTLSSLTVVAEVDKQNLNYIGEALNNEIDVTQDLGQNLMKIARGIVQSNIKDGVISIKSIPIPKGGTLPYEGGGNGQVTTLFEALGAHPVSGKRLSNTIKKYTLGYMEIQPMFNDYRAYMTEYSIYLPFSGIHKLDADLIVNNKLIITVDIDFLMGSMLYHIAINDSNTYRDLYQFTGDCGVELPITIQDYSAKYQSLMNGVFTGVGMAAGAIAGPGGAIGGMLAAGAIGTGLQTLGNIATVPGNYIQSGKLVPNASTLSVLNVYLIVTTPQEKTPNIAHTKGLPCHRTGTLSSFSGFTIATQCDLSGVPYATDEDKEAIRSMLASGVYL